jgi:A/G-specific adenine glycosylase
MPRQWASRLLNWYAEHGRQLPWRNTRDPYRIWVSETMLQQTQVDAAIPYYHRWLKRFPNVRVLASASLQDVLALWEGLGYYARARNLHRAAQEVMREHGGRLPRTRKEMRQLPGVGPYTAAAVASMAFGEDAAVLDGNVKRVLARVFDFREDVKSPSGERQLWALAESLVPRGRAGDYNQALMDLGATLCTPRAPACAACPVRSVCLARKRGVQLQRPVRRARPALPHRILAAGVVHKNGSVLITQRPEGKLLGGLWAFPSATHRGGENQIESLRRVLRDDFKVAVAVGQHTQTLLHTFTHFRQTQHVFDCRWMSGRLTAGPALPCCKWVRVADLEHYPMGKTDRQIARGLRANQVK